MHNGGQTSVQDPGEVWMFIQEPAKGDLHCSLHRWIAHLIVQVEMWWKTIIIWAGWIQSSWDSAWMLISVISKMPVTIKDPHQMLHSPRLAMAGTDGAMVVPDVAWVTTSFQIPCRGNPMSDIWVSISFSCLSTTDCSCSTWDLEPAPSFAFFDRNGLLLPFIWSFQSAMQMPSPVKQQSLKSNGCTWMFFCANRCACLSACSYQTWQSLNQF